MAAKNPINGGKRRSRSSHRPKQAQDPQSGKLGQRSRVSSRIPLVGIGASAGGLSALKTFFSQMPSDSGLSFVVIVHRSRDSKSLLASLLAKETKMMVQEVTETTKIEPNQVYLPKPGGQFILYDHQLKIKMNPSRTPALQFPIDTFFNSLAKKRQSKAVGIILSGTGTDGTLGAKAIRSTHGLTIAQEEKSAEFSAMPHHAISMGFIDHILKVEEMPKTIIQFLRPEAVTQTRTSPASSALKLPQKSLATTLSIIRAETGHDYTSSEFSSVQLKIQQRMQLKNIQLLDQYNQFLIEHPEEAAQLSRDLLISQPWFFRDARPLKELKKEFLKRLQVHPRREPFRVWVAGCSISEEAYTIAILLHECCQQFSPSLPYKIFATDLDSHAIELARTGRFPPSIEKSVDAQRMDKCFTKRHNQWFIRKTIRDHIVFSAHDIFSDPPFMQLDALCCRNLFMPTEQPAQKRLLHLFHAVLKPKGILFLSTDKILKSQPDNQLFTSTNKQVKLFRRSERKVDQPHGNRIFSEEHQISSFPPSISKIERPKQFSFTGRGQAQDYSQQIEEVLLKYHVPPCVLTTMKGDMVYMFGNTSEYFKRAGGEPYASLNLLDLIRPELKSPLVKALHQIRDHRHFLILYNLSYDVEGTPSAVDILVRRLSHPLHLRDLLLITFDTLVGDHPGDISDEKLISQTTHINRKLNRELKKVKYSLQTTIEELESANEEMNETYEEIQSANEELYSMNAELESAKQETQALNEELQMINTELQNKIDDLVRIQDNFANLVNGTNVAVLFLDRHMRITYFTPQVSPIFRLLETDIGRPISDLNSRLTTPRALDYGQQVLKTNESQEFEEPTLDNIWYSIRISPYRTSTGELGGVMMAFQDITAKNRAEERTRTVLETVVQPLVMIDNHYRIVMKNEAFTEHFVKRNHGPENLDIVQVLNVPQNEQNRLKANLREVFQKNQAMNQIEFIQERQNTYQTRWICMARPVHTTSQEPLQVLMAFTKQE